MKIYRAETGQQVNWQPKTNVETLGDFQQELESCTGVSADNQIIMTSYGTQVKQTNVKEVVEATGQNEYIVFFFDRQYLDALPEDIAALLDVETPTLEPKIAPFDKTAQLKALKNISHKQSLRQTCEQFLSIFAFSDAYSQSLMRASSTHTQLGKSIVEGQKLQSMALNVALANLESHNTGVSKSVEKFVYLAEKELIRQSDLVNSIHNDLGILRNIKIHPSILPLMTIDQRHKDRLVDFIDESAINTLKSETMTFCNHSAQQIRELQGMVKHLQVYEKELQQHVAKSTNLQALDAALADIQELCKSAQLLRDRIKRDLTRVYNKIADLLKVPISSLFSIQQQHQQQQQQQQHQSITSSASSSSTSPIISYSIPREVVADSSISSSSGAKKNVTLLADLVDVHLNEYLPKLSDYENQIRQRITELTISKRRSIQNFIQNMNTISLLQNDIAEVMPKLSAADDYMKEFKDMNGDGDLESARKILFAYGALMIEIVRRNEYIALLIENANLFADLFARYRDQEEERRAFFRHEVYQLLPFKLSVLDKVSPQCDITTTARDDDESFKLRKKDIVDFISLLTQAYAQTPQSGPSSPKVSSKRLTAKRVSSATSVTIKGSSSGRRVTVPEQSDNKLLNLLNDMNHQLNGLKYEFMKALESSFFPGSSTMSGSKLKIKDQSYLKADRDTESILLQKSMAEDQLKAYEARITSLERTLRNTIRSNEKNTMETITSATNELSLQTKKKLSDLETENKNQALEIQKLKETIKNLEEERSVWEQEKATFEQEKEELEQMLDEERQMFEHNRQSLLNEAKIKDNLADIRIATAEEDWRGKIDDLQHALQEATQMRQNLEIEHASEIETLTQDCRAQVEELNKLLQESQDRVNHDHLDQIQLLSDEKENLEKEKAQLETSLETVKSQLDALNQTLITERSDFQNKISQLQTKIVDSEKARDEIKLLQAQTRAMVNRAQDDWVAKNDELQNIKREHESVRVAIGDLLARYMGDTELIDQESDLEAVIQIFQQNLNSFTIRSDMARQNLESMEADYQVMSQNYKDLVEEHSEWRSIASRMAEKLEEYRKNFMFELINHLQLAVDEDEINALSKKVTFSDDDAAIWSEILQISSTIDTQKMVIRLRKRFKELHDSAKQYKKEYKELKDKYSKLSSSFTEKIAFRNFKVGDVALFLPTRNSSGKPWAAFNINAPHYFLNPTDYVLGQMTKEWIVARIVSITEHVTDPNKPESNPYGLANNLTYYQLTVENWKNHRNGSSKRRSKESTSAAPSSMTSSIAETVMNRKNSYTSTSAAAGGGIKQDSGLASITQELTSPNSPETNTAVLSQKRPVYPLSISSSNIVHSYVNTSTSQFNEDERRRRSIDYIKTKE